MKDEGLSPRSVTSFQKRAASALILGPLAFAIIVYGGWPFAVFVVALAILAFYEWAQLSLKIERKVLHLLVGFVYVVVSFLCCYMLRMNYPVPLALLFIIMVWASDIGAYLVGKTIGGAKMTPEISPNKTWSGYAGALLVPAIVTVVALLSYDAFVSRLELDTSQLFLAAGAGALVGGVGQSGDLLVSSLKRGAKVKDTGQLIPGHGGLLDRIDSMMLAAPVFLFVVSRYPDVFTG